jgi:putative membrane protein
MKPVESQTRIPLGTCLLLVLSGILIGGGAILPGISGGVLCVIFGIYRPMMELLSHPKRALPKY